MEPQLATRSAVVLSSIQEASTKTTEGGGGGKERDSFY